jgi:folate-binding protein YgfZ
VYKDADSEFILDINADSRASFIARLGMYKLRSLVDISDISNEMCILYSKDEISDAVYSLKDPRYSKLSFRTLLSINKVPEDSKKSDALYLADKYKYYIIDGGIDLKYDKSIPIEFGAIELGAIDFDKGCYIGQEVISRTKYLGEVRKKIFGLQIIDGTNIAPLTKGDEIRSSSGDLLGHVCSSYKNAAISLLREEKYLGLEKKEVIIKDSVYKVVVPPWRR